MNYSPHDSCALYVNNPESICYKPECRSSRQCERTKPDPKDARIAELEARAAKLEHALEWALEWIDAVPANGQLPAMPGFDREYVDRLLARQALTGERHDTDK